MTHQTTQAIHLMPEDYHLIGPETFGSPGLWARESVGPYSPIEAVGPLVTIHDSRFDPHCGIGHHPHRGMERLFYIVEGAVDHNDALNEITGHMASGDLGVLTEGRRGMLHSEWNNGQSPARAYILVYPADPLPATASFDAIRDNSAAREHPSPGVETKVVVDRVRRDPLHGDIRQFADTSLTDQALLEVAAAESEAVALFVLDGAIDVEGRDGSPATAQLGRDDTLLLPPSPEARRLCVTARQPSRVLHAVTGAGFGLRFRDSAPLAE